MFYTYYSWVAVVLLVQGVAYVCDTCYTYAYIMICSRLTIMIPVLYGLTLGLVGRDSMSSQTSLNEYYSHMGTAIYAAAAGWGITIAFMLT